MKAQYEIKYINKWNGQPLTKSHDGSMASARGWLEVIAKDSASSGRVELYKDGQFVASEAAKAYPVDRD